MRRNYYVRLFLSYLVYGALILLLVLTFTQKYTQRYMEQEEARRLYREATLISTDYATEFIDSSISLPEFQQQMELISDYLSARIWVMDPHGNLLLDSMDASIGRAAAAAEPRYTKVEDFRISDFGNSYSQIGTFYGSFPQEMLTVYAPITVSYKVRGYILIHKTCASISSHTDGFVNIAFYTTLIVFVGSLLLLFFNSWMYFYPLRKITKAAESYAKGDFSQKIEVKGASEVAYLADTLNFMASEMDKMEEEQRKFVSNVSHDFRSPLTSIRGYIVAMLDGTIPVEFQERYLNIILFETDRLAKLTQSLLDLNQFGRHGITLDISDFDINQMIRTTVMTFEGICNEKKLHVDLLLTGKELFVRADASKIQQVLYNLIDNATKFSRKNTSIKVETTIRNGKVIVSVKDHGIGIPAESINKIWERFYKTDQSRGKDKRGSGLGLAIVKEIMSAHNENINCVSTEGVGTEFTFTLPLSEKEE